MGVDWSAVAVIGVVLPQARWYRTEEQSHQEQTGHVSGKKAYCPECGQKNERTTIQVPLFEGGDGDEEEDPENYDTHIGRFRLHWSSDDEYGYLGIVVETDSNRGEGNEPVRASQESFAEIGGMWEELAALLTPLGLWEPESFGLRAMLLCSD